LRGVMSGCVCGREGRGHVYQVCHRRAPTQCGHPAYFPFPPPESMHVHTHIPSRAHTPTHTHTHNTGVPGGCGPTPGAPSPAAPPSSGSPARASVVVIVVMVEMRRSRVGESASRFGLQSTHSALLLAIDRSIQSRGPPPPLSIDRSPAQLQINRSRRCCLSMVHLTHGRPDRMLPPRSINRRTPSSSN
jgi:hypothetical protein